MSAPRLPGRAPECPKCGHAMHQGYLLDQGHSDRRRVLDWIAGAPEKSFWRGLTTKGRPVLPVTSWRCERCGYLESYAYAPS